MRNNISFCFVLCFVSGGFWCYRRIDNIFTPIDFQTVINKCLLNNLLNKSFKTR